MTCAQCGMTVGWDCACDPEYNALIEEGLKRDAEAQRKADARIVELHQQYYGPDAGDAILRGDSGVSGEDERT